MGLGRLPSSLGVSCTITEQTRILPQEKPFISPRSISPVDLDRHGDVKLRVGQEKKGQASVAEPTVFTACSSILARISPVFDRMLFGHFAEARKPTGLNQEWTVDLLNDKPEAMKILLDIAHCHFYAVPKSLTLDQLYNLTVLTNYYDATALLSPWVSTWVACVDNVTKDGARNLLPKVLWVAWELGHKSILEETAQRMVMEFDGPPFMDRCEQKNIQTPPDVVERIDAIRTQTIQSLLEVFRDMAEALLVVDERPRWCRHAQWMGHHRCESMILGSMTFCLARAGLWPLPEAEEVNYSILGLYGKLTGLVIHDIGEETTQGPHQNHAECNPQRHLLREVGSIMDEIPKPLTEIHVAALDRQRQRLRID